MSQRDALLLINANQIFEKGDPKNFIPENGITKIVDTFTSWTEEDKFSRIVHKAEIIANDYRISPSHYIHTSEAAKYREISEIVEELRSLEAEAGSLDAEIGAVIEQVI